MIHVGFAETDVTPPLGAQSPGGMGVRVVKEIHDPLRAVAMVIRNDSKRIALVGLDALFITADITAAARERIARETQDLGRLGSHRVPSHTHAGGPIASCFESEADPAYVKIVAERISDAVMVANARLHAAEIGCGFGHEPSISFNRRFLMRDGRQMTHPGKGNADIVKPAGPIDPDVGVLAARGANGELLGLFVNFACHLTVGSGPGFSADYVYFSPRYAAAALSPSRLTGWLPARRRGRCGRRLITCRPGRESGPEWGAMFGLAPSGGGRPGDRQDGMAERRSNSRPIRTTVPILICDEPRGTQGAPASGLGAGGIADKIYARERELIKQERLRESGRSVRGAGHADRRPGHRHERRGVLLRARARYQGGQPIPLDVGRHPGERLGRL